MKAPVPHLIYRPSRSVPATILALILLVAGGLGAWLTGYRLITGSWPHRMVNTLDTVGAASLSSIAMLVAAGIAAAFGIFLVIAALWPGRESTSRSCPAQSPVRPLLPAEIWPPS